MVSSGNLFKKCIDKNIWDKLKVVLIEDKMREILFRWPRKSPIDTP